MTYPHRYDRNRKSLSRDECAELARATVTVAGCGGLGGLVIEALARIGVGHLRVIDGDKFEENNLNRQLLCTEDALGREKALVAAERILMINSEVDAKPLVTFIEETNAQSLLTGSDCVVDCLDNLASRFWLAHACQQLGTPVVYGAIAGWFGQVCTVYPGDVSFTSVYGEPFESGGESQHKMLGNLPCTAYAIAAVQASETVKVLLGRPNQIRNRLLMLDLLDGSADDMELRWEAHKPGVFRVPSMLERDDAAHLWPSTGGDSLNAALDDTSYSTQSYILSFMKLDCGIAEQRIVKWLRDELLLVFSNGRWEFFSEAGDSCSVATEKLENRSLGIVSLERTLVTADGDPEAIAAFRHAFTLRFLSAGGWMTAWQHSLDALEL